MGEVLVVMFQPSGAGVPGSRDDASCPDADAATDTSTASDVSAGTAAAAAPTASRNGDGGGTDSGPGPDSRVVGGASIDGVPAPAAGCDGDGGGTDSGPGSGVGGDASVDDGPGWGATLGLFDGTATNHDDGAGVGAACGAAAGVGCDDAAAAAGARDDAADAAVGGPADAGSGDAGPGWGASRGDVECPRVGPFWDHLAAAQTAVTAMLADLHDRQVPSADVAEATVALHRLDIRVRAVHAAAVAQTVAAGAMPVWAVSPAAWIRHSHLLDSTRASTVVLNATWLAEDGHDLIRQAFEAGEVTADHVTSVRAVAAKTKTRRAAFLVMQEHLVEVARNCDPAQTATTLTRWADAVDATDGDDDAEKAWNKRGLYLSPVGDGWDIRGYLPAAEGAELAGILNAFTDKAYRARHINTDHDGSGSGDGACGCGQGCDGDGDHNGHDGHGAGHGGGDGPGRDGRQGTAGCEGDPGCGCGQEGVEEKDPRTAAQQRADALLDLARAAADADLTDGAYGRAKVTVLLPGERLWTCPTCGGHHHRPNESCHGPGHGLWTGTPDTTGDADPHNPDSTATADAADAARRWPTCSRPAGPSSTPAPGRWATVSVRVSWPGTTRCGCPATPRSPAWSWARTRNR